MIDKADEEIPILRQEFLSRIERKIPIDSAILEMLLSRAGGGGPGLIGFYKLADLNGYERPQSKIIAFTETLMRDFYGGGLGFGYN